MATWNGKPVKAAVEVVKEGWLDHEEHEFRWEYQTTADCLSIFENGERWVGADYERARVLWAVLDDWARTYLGEHGMQQLRDRYIANSAKEE